MAFTSRRGDRSRIVSRVIDDETVEVLQAYIEQVDTQARQLRMS